MSGDDWFVAGNVIRHPKTGYPLLTITYKAFPNDSTVMCDGVNQPGVAAYLMGNLQRFGLSYNVCVGERGVHGQGARFELPSAPDTWQGLWSMYEHIKNHPEEFEPRQPVEFDRLYNLAIQMPRDVCGILSQQMTYLADKNVNVRYVRAEKDEVNHVLGLPEVKLFAQLEVPGIDIEVLENDLRLICPRESKVKLRQLWQRSSNDQADEPDRLISF